MRLPFALSDGFPLMKKNNMGILNTRRFVNVNTTAVNITNEQLAKASSVVDKKRIAMMLKNKEKFEFVEDLEQAKELEEIGFKYVHWFVKTDARTGRHFQACELLDEKGNTGRCRLYGTNKELVREETRPLSEMAIGYCYSGSEIQEEPIVTGYDSNGEAITEKFPIVYVHYTMKRGEGAK